jgi:hypothetical protein
MIGGHFSRFDFPQKREGTRNKQYILTVRIIYVTVTTYISARAVRGSLRGHHTVCPTPHRESQRRTVSHSP